MKGKKEKFNSFTYILKFIMGVLSWTVFVILVLIAAFLMYYFVATKVYAQKGEEFRPFISLYTIITESMEPNINPYDVIVDVYVKNPEDIKIGDVITFTSTSPLTKGMVITHRVVNIAQDASGYSYQTKGDNNLSPDASYVPFANVHGKVLLRIPKLGYLQSFLATKGGWLIVVVIPALFIIISDIVKLFRLLDAKNNVETIQKKEEKKKKKVVEQKKAIEINLQQRYTPRRKFTDRDPVEHKNFTLLQVLSEQTLNIHLPKKKRNKRKMDLPKLKK